MSDPQARLEVRMTAEQKAQIQELADIRGVYVSDIVRAALDQLLETPTAQEMPLTDVSERLERLEKLLETFIKVYLSTTPPVPTADADAYALRGTKRWGQFLALLTRKDMAW